MYKCGIRIIGKRYYQLMTYLTISRHNTVIDNDFLYLQTTYEQARETLVLIVYASSSGPNRQCSRIFDNEFWLQGNTDDLKHLSQCNLHIITVIICARILTSCEFRVPTEI